MLISKFNLNRFFLRKKENKEVDLESTRGEVRSLGKKAGLSYYDRVMLDNVIGFSSIEVEEAMVPRADIVAIPEKSSLKECIDLFRKAAHSRLPVYRGTLDEVIGMVHVKDILTFWDNDKDFILENIIRKVIISAPSTLISDLFQEMRRTKVHLSIVVDEHGGTDGLITIEDLLEEITGEIEDEHDTKEKPLITALENGALLVDARTDIIDLDRALGVNFSDIDLYEDIETVGGLIFTISGKIPKINESIPEPRLGVNFKILEADHRKIHKVLVSRGET